MREAALSQATTQLHRNFTALAAAIEEDVRDRVLSGTLSSLPSKRSTDGQFSAEGFVETLLPSLKAQVLAPASGAESTCAHVANYGFYWRSEYNVEGGSAKDIVVHSNCMTQQICEAYNAKYTTLSGVPVYGSVWPADQANWDGVGGGNSSFCFKYGTEYRFTGLAALDVI